MCWYWCCCSRHCSAVAKTYGATLLPGGVSLQGWRITTVKAPIIGDAQIDAFRATLGGVVSLPEIVFGNSCVTLTHEASGATVSFTALDALRGWVDEGLPPLQVADAAQWQRARESDIKQHRAHMLQYDWTFTTKYIGTYRAGPNAPPAAASAAAPPPPPVDGSSAAAGAAGSSVAPSQDGFAWEDTCDQIDRGLLMERDPILFYDEVPLYESDLDDTGGCSVTVRLRVMPKCWLVLVRYWLRVDGMLVKLRDTRLFCAFSQPGRVLREVRWCEGSYEELRRGGAPCDNVAFGDAEATANAFNAVAPTGLKRHQLQKVVLT